jgi:hemerythrin-like domain-containing protein
METIYDILREEHDQIADLIEQAKNDRSKESFYRIKNKTDPHLLGEEKLFYPFLEQKEELRDLVNHAYKEHSDIRSVSYELEKMSSHTKEWESKILDLEKTVQHHVQEEEEKIFPEAQKVLSEDKAQDIAQKYLEFSRNFQQQPSTR